MKLQQVLCYTSLCAVIIPLPYQEEDGLGLSSFPCSLCDSGKTDIRDPDKIKEGFKINRSSEALHSAGHMARINPNQLNREQLAMQLKGSKAIPLSLGGNQAPARKCYESLHFKLSMARFVKNILARLNAGIYVWQIDQKLRPLLQPHEDQLAKQLCKVLGIQQRLSIQGNEADKILRPENVDDVLSLLVNTDGDMYTHMKFFLTELSFLNKVIQTLKPKEHFSLIEFKERARGFQLFLLDKFGWASWPDYLHAELENVTIMTDISV